MSKNLRGLSARAGLERGLYEQLIQTARRGDADQLHQVAEELLTGEASVLATGSFYDLPRQEREGKKVLICDGAACLVSGQTDRVRAALGERFADADIGHATCLGHCHTNDAFLYRQATWSIEDLGRLDESADAVPMPGRVTTGANTGTPILLAPMLDLASGYAPIIHLARHPEQGLAEIERSGLRGRGGAGFPFHRKLQAARDAPGKQKYVVCNADEGDPGSFSDKWLLEERPHAVLAGMMAVGVLIGAQTGILYIRGEYPESIQAISKAVDELARLGLSGADVGGSGRAFHFRVIEGAGAYLCGEETALLNSLEGLRPEVRIRPPFPATYGLFGQPTIVSNVETLANLRFILAAGGQSYAAQGTPKSTGTKLVSLDGAFRRPGVYEAVMGTPLREVIDDLGGGTRYPVKAFQIGGPLGGLVPACKVDDLTLDFESFAENGFLLGHAGVVSIPNHFPIARFLEHLFDFTARESCGKCFPCRIGARRGQELLAGALDRGERMDRELFADLLETLQLGSLCALGGGLPLPIRNALTYFSDELAPLFRHP